MATDKYWQWIVNAVLAVTIAAVGFGLAAWTQRIARIERIQDEVVKAVASNVAILPLLQTQIRDTNLELREHRELLKEIRDRLPPGPLKDTP
jgi:hypothetical protein